MILTGTVKTGVEKYGEFTTTNELIADMKIDTQNSVELNKNFVNEVNRKLKITKKEKNKE